MHVLPVTHAIVFIYLFHVDHDCDNWMPAIIECLPMLVNTKRICLQWTRGWQIQTLSGGVVRSALDSVLENSLPKDGARVRCTKGRGSLSAYNYTNIWIVCRKNTMHSMQYSTSQPHNPTNLSTPLWWQWNKQEGDRTGHTNSIMLLRLTGGHANLL